MSDAQKFFFEECATHARSMPLSKAAVFLQGLLVSCGTSPDPELHRIYLALSESDKQLELIQTGQLKLNLGGKSETHHGGKS